MTQIESILTDLQELINTKQRNGWVQTDQISVYFRIGSFRNLPAMVAGVSTAARMIDLANVSIAPEFQRQGIFTTLLKGVEKIVAESVYPYVYIENVINPNILGFLERTGYVCADSLIYQYCHQGPPSYYRDLRI